MIHMTIEILYLYIHKIYIHLHTFTYMHTLKSCSHYTHPESTQVINYTV